MTTVLGLREWRCRRCRYLLCRCAWPAGTHTEIKCGNCNTMNVAVVPERERLTESVQTTVMIATVYR